MNGIKNSHIDPKHCRPVNPVMRTIITNTKDRKWYKQIYKMLHRKVTYVIVEDYYCYIPFLGVTLFIPKGFIFDGASIPKWLWPLIAPIDVLCIAAVFHDFAYRYQTYLTDTHELYLPNLDKGVYDSIFKNLSIYTNGLLCTSWMAYIAVLIFGRVFWNQNRKEKRKIKKDFPNLVVTVPTM